MLFSCLAAFVVAFGRFSCILVRSGLDFRGLRGTPRMVLEAPRPCISRFSRGRGHALLDMLYVHETPLKLMRNAYRPSSTQRKKLPKFASGPCRTELFAKIVLKTRLWARRAWFWRGLGPSWATPGRHMAGLWPLLGGTWSLSGASWATLRHSWVSPG